MLYSRITGIGSYLPARDVPNAELAARIDTSDEWIRERTGIESRHLAADGEMPSDMGLVAAQRALEMAGVEASQIDLIIFASTTPDMIFPSSSCLLQSKLGLKGCAALDVNAACSGFVYGLATADKFVRSGSNKCVLVVGAEVLSRILDWTDRRTCVLFGDGAGAAVVQPSSEPGILSSHLHADGTSAPILNATAQIAHGKIVGSPFVFMEGQAVFKLAVRVLEEVVHEALKANQMTAKDIDWLVPHQANIRIINATAQKLGIEPARVITTVQHHGNTSAASIPLALDVAVKDGRIKRGQTVLVESVGGGMTWGSVLMRW